jgi:hypothetical protein
MTNRTIQSMTDPGRRRCCDDRVSVSAALAQSPSPTIRGSWSATAGPNQILQYVDREPTAANPTARRGRTS